MKTLVLAFIFCLCGALILYFCLVTWFGVDHDAGKAVASIILGAFPKVREAMQKGRGPEQPEVRPLQAFRISPALATLYVSIVGFAVLGFTGGVAGLLAAIGNGGLDSLAPPLAIITFIFTFPMLFLCGRWIGRRCSYRPILIAVCCAIAIRILGTFFDVMAIPAVDYVKIYGHEKTASNILIQISAGSAMFAILLVSGALLGRRQRLSNYFNYLLRQITPEGRGALVELAYEEASRIKLGDQVRRK
jgi:hypothetical protein